MRKLNGLLTLNKQHDMNIYFHPSLLQTESSTKDSQYIIVKYTILHIVQPLRRQNFGQTLNSLKTAIPHPNRRAMTVFCELLGKSDRKISAVHRTKLDIDDISHLKTSFVERLVDILSHAPC